MSVLFERHCGAPVDYKKLTQAESTFTFSIALQIIGKMGELSVLIRLAKGEKVTLDEVEEQQQSCSMPQH